MASNTTQAKESDPQPVQSVWEVLVWLLTSIPWWIVKFVDWIYTVITAIIIRLFSKGSM